METRSRSLYEDILTDLFGSGFVADGGFEMDGWPTGTRGMTPVADEDSEAGLLEYRSVVVVGVPHRPAAHVFRRFTAAGLVRSQTTAVRQHLERVVFTRLQLAAYNTNTQSH